MATFSAPTGVWTAITGIDTVAAGKTNANVPLAGNLNFESLKTVNGIELPELNQFIQFMADGYNISFWAAYELLGVIMRGRQGAPDQQITRVLNA